MNEEKYFIHPSWMGYELEERSAGAIIFHESEEGRRYLLLKYPAGHWDFPKGNVEEGEELEQTVKREVKEETGLSNIQIIDGFKKRIEYFYRRDGKTIHKEVTFLLAKCNTDAIKLSFEHQDYGWFRYSDALARVTYSNSKRLLIEAEEFLNGIS